MRNQGRVRPNPAALRSTASKRRGISGPPMALPGNRLIFVPCAGSDYLYVKGAAGVRPRQLNQLPGATPRLKVAISVKKNAHGTQITAGIMTIAPGTPEPALSNAASKRSVAPMQKDQKPMYPSVLGKPTNVAGARSLLTQKSQIRRMARIASPYPITISIDRGTMLESIGGTREPKEYSGMNHEGNGTCTCKRASGKPTNE